MKNPCHKTIKLSFLDRNDCISKVGISRASQVVSWGFHALGVPTDPGFQGYFSTPLRYQGPAPGSPGLPLKVHRNRVKLMISAPDERIFGTPMMNAMNWLVQRTVRAARGNCCTKVMQFFLINKVFLLLIRPPPQKNMVQFNIILVHVFSIAIRNFKGNLSYLRFNNRSFA